MKSFEKRNTSGTSGASRARSQAVAVALALVALAGPAHAGTLTTPPLSRGAAANDFHCRITNIAPKTATGVEMTIRDSSGGVNEYASKGFVQSLQSTGLLSFADPAPIAYCEVEGTGIVPSKARVTFCVRDWNNTPLECVTAP